MFTLFCIRQKSFCSSSSSSCVVKVFLTTDRHYYNRTNTLQILTIIRTFIHDIRCQVKMFRTLSVTMKIGHIMIIIFHYGMVNTYFVIKVLNIYKIFKRSVQKPHTVCLIKTTQWRVYRYTSNEGENSPIINFTKNKRRHSTRLDSFYLCV